MMMGGIEWPVYEGGGAPAVPDVELTSNIF